MTMPLRDETPQRPVAVTILCLVYVPLLALEFISYLPNEYLPFIHQQQVLGIFIASGIRFTCRLGYIAAFIGIWRMRAWGVLLCLSVWLLQLIPATLFLLSHNIPVNIGSSEISLCIFLICIIPYRKKFMNERSVRPILIYLVASIALHSAIITSVWYADNARAYAGLPDQVRRLEQETDTVTAKTEDLLNGHGEDTAIVYADSLAPGHLRAMSLIVIADHFTAQGERQKSADLLVKAEVSARLEPINGVRATTFAIISDQYSQDAEREKSLAAAEEAKSAALQLEGVTSGIDVSAIFAVVRALSNNDRESDALSVANIADGKLKATLTEQIQNALKTKQLSQQK